MTWQLRQVLQGAALFCGFCVCAAAALAWVISEGLIRRSHGEPAAFSVPVSNEVSAQQEGRYLAEVVLGCTSCHGTDLAGAEVSGITAPGRLYAPNLTAGEGGLGRTYTDLDFLYAVRHGRRANGRSLWWMPCEEYRAWPLRELAPLISWIEVIPPVDRKMPSSHLYPSGRIALLGDGFPLLSVAQLHEPAGPFSERPLSRGALLASTCTGCHGPELRGGRARRAPDTPVGPGIGAGNGGPLETWSQADFYLAMTNGQTPDGRQLSDAMPWRRYGGLRQADLAALWGFLESLPLEAMEQD